jgi:hypothetical protein
MRSGARADYQVKVQAMVGHSTVSIAMDLHSHVTPPVNPKQPAS